MGECHQSLPFSFLCSLDTSLPEGGAYIQGGSFLPQSSSSENAHWVTVVSGCVSYRQQGSSLFSARSSTKYSHFQLSFFFSGIVQSCDLVIRERQKKNCQIQRFSCKHRTESKKREVLCTCLGPEGEVSQTERIGKVYVDRELGYTKPEGKTQGAV